MRQRFSLSYHQLVAEVDIPRLSREWALRIQWAIEHKLTVHPDIFGKPLRRSLAGYRKLRVGDYRVIFRIVDTEIRILTIGHRREVYRYLEQRIV